MKAKGSFGCFGPKEWGFRRENAKEGKRQGNTCGNLGKKMWVAVVVHGWGRVGGEEKRDLRKKRGFFFSLSIKILK